MQGSYKKWLRWILTIRDRFACIVYERQSTHKTVEECRSAITEKMLTRNKRKRFVSVSKREKRVLKHFSYIKL